MTDGSDDLAVSAVVCTYNGSELIEECIESLLSQSFDHSYEVVIVDDGSTDGTAELVQGIDSARLRLIEHDRNRGLAAARNTGWQSTDGTIVAYIDDDAIAPQDWLQSLYEGYDEDIDGVGGYPAEYGDSHIDRYEVTRTEVIYGKEGEDVEGAGGMNMSFRRSVLSDIGGFDDQFTHIADDADLNRRLLDEGYTLRVDPSIRVYHMFPRGIVDFARKKFKRGLGPALMHSKYGNLNVGRMLLSAAIHPFFLPYSGLEAYRYWSHAEDAELLWFSILTYLDNVFTSLGIMYYLWQTSG